MQKLCMTNNAQPYSLNRIYKVKLQPGTSSCELDYMIIHRCEHFLKKQSVGSMWVSPNQMCSSINKDKRQQSNHKNGFSAAQGKVMKLFSISNLESIILLPNRSQE